MGPIRLILTASLILALCAAVAAPSSVPVLSVRDFGATADDETDDTAAFERALAAAAAGPVNTVFVPPGRYLLTAGQLRLESGVTLLGAGARHSVLQGHAPGDPDALLLLEGEELAVRDLTLRGREGGEPPHHTASGTLLQLRRAHHVRLENCRFEQFSHAVHAQTAEGGFYTVSDVAVRDCRFRRGGVGLAAQACERISVSRSQFEDLNWASSMSRTLGVRFEHNEVRRCETGVRGLHAFDVHVNHNSFRHIGSNGAVQFDTAVGGEIAYNVVDNQDTLHTGWNLEVEAGAGIVIHGNVVRASQHQTQIGLWLHGRNGGFHDWGINPFDPERAGMEGFETPFVSGSPEEVAQWTVTQPAAVTLAADPGVTWHDHPSFRLRLEPGAQPGVVAWRPYTPDQQHRVYGDMIVGFVAVRGNTGPAQALALALCLEETGQRPAQTLVVPSVSARHADKWLTYRSVIYETGAGFGEAGYAGLFAPFRSVAVILREPLEEPLEVHLGIFRRDLNWQSNRDAGVVVSGNTFSNAVQGIVLSQLQKNVTITGNVLEASQSQVNEGAMAFQLLSWHAVVRNRSQQVDSRNLPPDPPPDWVPLFDPVPTLPGALVFENCRIAGNTVQGYRQFVGVAGPDNGRFILREPRLGLRVDDNQLQEVQQFVPADLPALVSIRGNVRDNQPLTGTFRLGEQPLVIENANLTPTAGVRLTPVSPEAFGAQPRVLELEAGRMIVDPGGAPGGAHYAWEIWCDHLPR